MGVCLALALAAKTAVIIENPPLVIDTYVFVALIKEMGGDAKIIHNKLHIDMKNVCINNDVFKLKAGEQISFFMHGETTTRHCFQYNYTLPETPFNADDCEKIIRKNIISTFNHGDVPIGLFLSGGIDSGIIASVLKERLRREENTLHIEYSGSFEEISEERMLLPLISELGIKCKRVLFDEVILDNIESIIFSLDEPFYSTVSASTYSTTKK